jgi:hypothetical protein
MQRTQRRSLGILTLLLRKSEWNEGVSLKEKLVKNSTNFRKKGSKLMVNNNVRK